MKTSAVMESQPTESYLLEEGHPSLHDTQNEGSQQLLTSDPFQDQPSTEPIDFDDNWLAEFDVSCDIPDGYAFFDLPDPFLGDPVSAPPFDCCATCMENGKRLAQLEKDLKDLQSQMTCLMKTLDDKTCHIDELRQYAEESERWSQRVTGFLLGGGGGATGKAF